MREQINRLARGIIEYEKAQLCVPKRLEETIVGTDTVLRSFLLYREDGKDVKGIVYSDNPLVTPDERIFYARENRILFQVDAPNRNGDGVVEGNFCLVTSAGEATVPFRYEFCAEEKTSTLPETPEDFAEMAKNDPVGASALFTSSVFSTLPFLQKQKLRTLYDGLRGHGNQLLAMEEFLVGLGLKEEVRLKTEEGTRAYHGINESMEDSISLEKNTWGSLRAEITVEGDFVSVPVTVLTEEDFEDGHAKIPFVVEKDRLKRGINRASIRINTIRQNFVIPVTAELTQEPQATAATGARAAITAFCRKAVSYLAIMENENRHKEQDELLNSMNSALGALRKTEYADDRMELMHTAVLLKLGRANQAGLLLEDLHDRVCQKRMNELGNYCLYLYLRSVAEGDTERRKQLVLILNRFYENSGEKDILLWLMLRTDSSLMNDPSLVMKRIRKRFEEGSRSPFLLIEAARLVVEDPGLLVENDRFSRQVLWTCLRYGCMNPGLSQMAGQAGTTSKTFDPALYMILTGFYRSYPTEKCLEGICSLLIKGERKSASAFRWYEKGVKEDVRLTRLYEYYLYALPEDYDRRLPQMILMYFSYNHALNRRAQEALYSNLLRFCRNDSELMNSYREQIEAFALNQMFDGVMDDRLGEIYRYAIYPDMIDAKTAKVLPRLLLARRITCDNPSVSQIVLCYQELEDEQIVPLTDGVAYVPVYTENCLILLQDRNGNRYVSLPLHSVEFFSDEEMLSACMEQDKENEMLTLRRGSQMLAKGGAVDGETLLSILRRGNLKDLYVKSLQAGVVAGCLADAENDNTLYLLSLDPKLLSPTDRTLVMAYMIDHGAMQDAYEWACRWGEKELSAEHREKLFSRIVCENDFKADERLLRYCYACLLDGSRDATIMEYLCRYYNGSTSSMLTVLHAAKEAERNLFDLPERILGQLLFSGGFEGLDECFADYAAANAADEAIVRAYLVSKSHFYITKDQQVPEEVFGFMENLIVARDVKNGMPLICMAALCRYYSTCEDLDGKRIELCREMIGELHRQGLVFGFYRDLSRFILLPGNLSDRLIVEYRGQAHSNVRIRMQIHSREEEELEEMVPRIYENIFVKVATVFAGEVVEYEIYDSELGEEPAAAGRLVMSSEGTPGDVSRGSLLNRILMDQQKNSEELRDDLTRYGAADHLSRHLFTIR